MAKRSKQRWWWTGLSRGALSGLLLTIIIGLWDTLLILHHVALEPKQAGMAGAFAMGLIGLVVLPWGMLVGWGVAALTVGRKRSLNRWLNELARQHERDVEATQRLLGVAATLLVLTSLTAGVANMTRAWDVIALGVVISILIAGLLGAVTQRGSRVLVERLPFESIGRPHLTKVQGMFYILTALLVAAVMLVAWHRLDLNVWPLTVIAQLIMVIMGPWLCYALLVRLDSPPSWSRHPLTLALSVFVIGALAVRPLAQFDSVPEVRDASLKHSGLEQRIMRSIMQVVGDRDGDGYASLWGGPDCDDGNAAIHPGAADVPGNDIDEDCSGEDATHVPEAPEITAPRTVAKLTAPKEPPQRMLPKTLSKSMVVAAGVALRGAWVTHEPVDAKGMNVVIVLVGSLRADRLAPTRYPRETTPVLNQLAEQSVVFTKTYTTAPSSPHAIPSLLTSRYPSEIAWRNTNAPHHPIDRTNTTLFEVLKAAGYRNHVLASHWYFRKQRRLDQGVEEYDNRGSVNLAPAYVDVSTPRIMARLDEHLDTLVASKKPWSLLIHLPDPHARYMEHTGKTPNWGKEPVDEYDREVFFVDAHITKLIEQLKDKGVSERTVIVVTSDHGEAFREHGFLFHGQTLYDEVLRVPWILHVPGVAPARINTPVSVLDIAPTLLDLLNIPQPAAFRGISVAGVLGPPVILPNRPLYAEHLANTNWNKTMRTLIAPPYKLHSWPEESRYELYNLDEDPGESTNLVTSHPDVAARLKNELQAFVTERLTSPR